MLAEDSGHHLSVMLNFHFDRHRREMSRLVRLTWFASNVFISDASEEVTVLHYQLARHCAEVQRSMLITIKNSWFVVTIFVEDLLQTLCTQRTAAM